MPLSQSQIEEMAKVCVARMLTDEKTRDQLFSFTGVPTKLLMATLKELYENELTKAYNNVPVTELAEFLRPFMRAATREMATTALTRLRESLNKGASS